MTFYNDNDPKAAAWLRELVRQGHLPEGDVNERSITELAAFECGTSSHFFSGIGGWPLALQLAGWPADRSVWTGSCPCQPFSAAGKGHGTSDPRHLWPEWFRLIRECRPDTIFGEQVESAIGHGWLDGVFADLEGEGYTCGAAVLGAHSVGAPHLRQRLFWVAHREGTGQLRTQSAVVDKQDGKWGIERTANVVTSGTNGGVALAQGEQLDRRGDAGGRGGELAECCGVGKSTGEQVGLPRQSWRQSDADCGVGHAERPTQERQRLERVSLEPQQEAERPVDATAWSDYELVGCADGKTRRIESGLEPLAHGVPARVGRLRGYGNAIVAQTAAAFVRAFLDVEGS